MVSGQPQPVNYQSGTEDPQSWKIVALVGVFFLVFAWPSFTLLGQIYNAEDDYSHGFMVPFVAAYFAYQIWQETGRANLCMTWIGFPILLLGVFSVILGYWYYIAILPDGLGAGFLLAVGLIFCVLGMSITFGGPVTLRIFSFPLTYLIFAIPFPKSVSLPLTLWLRNIVSVISEESIRQFGVTIFREGNVLHLANATLGIEDACSGIRSFWILMAGAAALAYMMKLGKVKSLLLCFLTLPISVAMNSIRVVLTALLVARFGIEYAAGWRHELCGWLTFVLGLVILVASGSFLMRKPKNRSMSDSISSKAENQKKIGSDSMTHPRKMIIAGTSMVLLSIGASANYVIYSHYVSRSSDILANRKPLSEFPDRIGSFTKVYDREILDEHLKVLQNTDYLIRTYKDESDNLIELRFIYWNPFQFKSDELRAGVSGHYPDNCFPSWGFRRLESGNIDRQIEGIPTDLVSIRVFEKSGVEQLVLYWLNRKIGKDLPDRLRNRLKTLFNSWNDPFIDRESQYVVTIVTKISGDRDAARNTAIDFARIIGPSLPEFGIH